MIQVDIVNWPRKNHYLLFKDFQNPFFNICANVEVTNLVEYANRNGFPFFATFLFLVMKTINKTLEFRYRIRENGVVLHDVVHPSYTVMTDEKLFRFVTTLYVSDMREFITNVTNDIFKSKKTISLEDAEGVDDLVYISSLKWVSFTSVSHPYDNKKIDSFPRVTWGKYYTDNNKIIIPVSVAAHHALCDGEHAAIFLNDLQKEINQLV
ncbi:MAG: chloramphenicol acetyltransferase [Candidatus Izemoplasmatales bacterium]|nr:chloramphenicol acetyltransferase [Candidatus Izemoplasmatales bacterium]MDD3864716.1 chloramphenicol acetyltransferase [Candidatus Izemoplasmatales bacterium]